MTATERTAVCFDLDYTLVDFDRRFDEICRDALATELDPVTDEAVEALLVALGDALDDQATDPYEIAVGAACEEAGVDADHAVLRDRLQEEEFAATSVAAPVREALSTLAEDEDLVLCVLSNGHDEVQRAKLAHHDLDRYVAHVVTSYDAGGTKASGEPYALLRERVDADRYVMIGDDYEGDVEAAREAGFVPIHYEETDGPDFFATLSAML